MTPSFAAALRRASRLTPARLTSATRSMQQAMTGFMVSTAFAPLTAMTPPKSLKSNGGAANGSLIPKPKAGQTLSAVLGKLRTARQQFPTLMGGAGRRAPAPVIPEGAQYLTRRHRSAAGAREYKLYVPASHPEKPEGLILMLHGCSQTPDDFALGTHMNTLAEKHGLIIAYPAQTRGSNAASCWNWFRPTNQRRRKGEPAILASLARKLTRDFGLGRDRVFVAGLSAGGAMAVILADVYPDVFAAAGVHSGLARGAAHDVRSAMSAMRSGGDAAGVAAAVRSDQALATRLIVFQGDADSTVHPSNAPMIVAAALGVDAVASRVVQRQVRGRGYTRLDYTGPKGTRLEYWTIKGAGHAWSGGRAAGSYTDRQGPDASAQMVRFFLEKPTRR